MSKEKKRHAIRYIAAGILIAALLGGLGFGLGSGFFGTSQAGGVITVNSLSPSSGKEITPVPTLDLKYNITVKENGIEYQGRSVTLAALRELLLENYSGSEVYDLCDDHAIKSVYDTVRSMLDDIGVPYVEK